MIPGGFYSNMQWVDVRNANAAKVPAFGIVRVTDDIVVSAGEKVVFTVDQPNSYGDVGTCLIAQPQDIQPDTSNVVNYGRATRSSIVLALYDDASGTPAYGQSWGPVSGSWKMSRIGQGWMALGAPLNTTLKTARFAAMPMTVIVGKIAADCAAGASADVTVWTGDYGSEVTTGKTIASVKNVSSCLLKSTDFVTAIYIQNNARWQFINGKTA